MSTAAERRRQKRAEKVKERRKEAQRDRHERAQRAHELRDPGPCYIAANWAERGAVVPAAFSRVQGDGKLTVALFECRLETGEITAIAHHVDWEPARLLSKVGEQGDAVAMAEVAPSLVARLFTDTAAFGAERGVAGSKALTALHDLIGEGWPRRDDQAILTGPPEPPKPARTGWFERLKRSFGRG